MHVAGRSLGTAARDLARAAGGDERAESMLTRFHGIGAAQTRAQRLHHLRTFVALLRSNEIPLDYVRLADDLVRLETPDKARIVRLSWARDLHRSRARRVDENSPETLSTTPENGVMA